MSSPDFVKLTLQLSLMLACAVVLGQAMRRLRQPAVVGEMFGGILLGPTVLAVVAPAFYGWLFRTSDAVMAVRETSTKLAMLAFLFAAGLEIDLSEPRRLGVRAGAIGLIGTLLPIAFGLGLVYAVPPDYWGAAVQPHFFSFALFVGMNLANSANPVIARILMDLRLLNTDVGALIMGATLVDDLVNWTLFAIILRDIGPASAGAGSPVASTAIIVLFCAAVLFVGRWGGPAAARFVRSCAWPNGAVTATALAILLAAAASEALGAHAFLGAFLVGVALGGARGDEKHHEAAAGQLVMSCLAPIYFVSMGMSTDFVQHFDATLVGLVFAAACVSKIGAVMIGARTAGMPLNREAWAVGFGLNARGATGVILAGVGRAQGVIDDRMFVAMVVMAMATSLLSGPMMTLLLAHRRQAPIGGLAAVTE
jgi:K+:H+ antiporter